MKSDNELYGEEETAARLRGELPDWNLRDGQICREYRTGGWKATMMLANLVGHLAEAAFHHPEMLLSYASVAVRLKTHSAGGITNKDFELAVKIESVVMWQPSLENGALEGTPDDERFRYILYR